MMRVSVSGLGDVGGVSAAGLARVRHEVIGVDINEEKTATINAGASPTVEPGLETLLADVVNAGRLSATATQGVFRQRDRRRLRRALRRRPGSDADISHGPQTQRVRRVSPSRLRFWRFVPAEGCSCPGACRCPRRRRVAAAKRNLALERSPDSSRGGVGAGGGKTPYRDGRPRLQTGNG